MKNKKVCVVGLGYIGLPTAVLIAKNGFNVVGVDIDDVRRSKIQEGSIFPEEPCLDKELEKVLRNKKFAVKSEPSKSEIFIIAVPTPVLDDKSPSLEKVFLAIDSITEFIESGNWIVIESTLSIGAMREISSYLKGKLDDNTSFNLAYSPERVLPGNILYELQNNSRIIGTDDISCSSAIVEFYQEFIDGDVRLTSFEMAELVKLTENSFRDVNIAFANELSLICSKRNLNVANLIELSNLHPRVNILTPGIGVGGHCIAVDPWFLVNAEPDETKLIRTARMRNLEKTQWVIHDILKKYDELKKIKPYITKVVCFGLSYKANSADTRESPALYIYRALIDKNIDVVAVDPLVATGTVIDMPMDIVEISDDMMPVILVAHDCFGVFEFPPYPIDYCDCLKENT